MKKKTQLALSKETLRTLSSQHLARVGGGYFDSPTDACGSLFCGGGGGGGGTVGLDTTQSFGGGSCFITLGGCNSAYRCG